MNRKTAFYVIYGDEEVYRKKRKYVLKPSEAYRLAEKIGLEHISIMKVFSLAPFQAYHLDELEKREMFEKWRRTYKKGGKENV